MAVILFKDGRSKKFDEYSFVDRLKEDWSLTDVGKVVTEETAEAVEVVEGPDFETMTKKEFEEYARGVEGKDGKPIELDRRMNKANMIKAFNEKKG